MLRHSINIKLELSTILSTQEQSVDDDESLDLGKLLKTVWQTQPMYRKTESVHI